MHSPFLNLKSAHVTIQFNFLLPGVKEKLSSCPTATTALDVFVEQAGCGGRDRAAEEALQQVTTQTFILLPFQALLYKHTIFHKLVF
jgi:hypothetical protein